MGSLSNYLENKMLDHIFGGSGVAQQYTPPSYLYIALFSDVPSAASGDSNLCVELPETNGYTRLPIPNTKDSWNVSENGALTNKIDFLFPKAEGTWPVISGVGVYDAQTNGNLLVWSSGNDPKSIGNGDKAVFWAGDFSITLD